MLAQSSDGVGARADVSPPTALVSQEVDAPRRILLLLLLLLSLVVDERVAVSLVLLVAVSVLRVEIHLGDRRAERAEEVARGPVEAVWEAMGTTQAVLVMLFGPCGPGKRRSS